MAAQPIMLKCGNGSHTCSFTRATASRTTPMRTRSAVSIWPWCSSPDCLGTCRAEALSPLGGVCTFAPREASFELPTGEVDSGSILHRLSPSSAGPDRQAYFR